MAVNEHALSSACS